VVAVKRSPIHTEDLRTVYTREKRLLEKTVNVPRVCHLIGGFEKHSFGHLILELATTSVIEALPVLDRTNAGAHMIAALAALHACGITHRDLRLENFLLFGHVVKISDLGLASDDHMMNTLGVQTWWYRAPEIFLGQQPYTASVDLWAMGMLIMHLWCGKAPYEDNEYTMLTRIFRDRGVPTPTCAHDLCRYGPSRCAPHPPLRRWHDCLAQLNPQYRMPIATLAQSSDVVRFANCSALHGFEQEKLASLQAGTLVMSDARPQKPYGTTGSKNECGKKRSAKRHKAVAQAQPGCVRVASPLSAATLSAAT
jgi:serine/threonine protein kinase